MALPKESELFDRAALSARVMEARNYPLDYAADLLIQHPSVLPAAIYDEVFTQMKNPFTETYAPVVLEWWAVTKEKENLYVFAAILANVYLELNNIARLENIPVLTSRREWMEWIETKPV
jgi:hypothetical protein